MHLDRARLQKLDVLVPPDAGDTLRFAAGELCRYLGQMSGVPLAPQRRETLRGARLTLGTAPEVPSPSSPDASRIARWNASSSSRS